MTSPSAGPLEPVVEPAHGIVRPPAWPERIVPRAEANAKLAKHGMPAIRSDNIVVEDRSRVPCIACGQAPCVLAGWEFLGGPDSWVEGLVSKVRKSFPACERRHWVRYQRRHVVRSELFWNVGDLFDMFLCPHCHAGWIEGRPEELVTWYRPWWKAGRYVPIPASPGELEARRGEKEKGEK